jgi:hypothetical protein
MKGLTMSNQRTIVVHKEGAEGTLQVEHLTGKIITPVDQRPDWAEGLAACAPQERITFYQQRLTTKAKGGSEVAFNAGDMQKIREADAIAFQDLHWYGVNAEQEAIEIEADNEYRLELLAKMIGVDTEAGTMGDGVVAERELAQAFTRRTQDEQDALAEATAAGFPEVEQEAARQHATKANK